MNRTPDNEPRQGKDRMGDATSRLEVAINDLVASVGDRAAEYVERAAERIERDLAERAPPRRRQREPAWLFSDEPRSRKLYRDRANGKVLGVCAGIAGYYGIERWVVRIAAVTAIIFLNWVALVAYLIAAVILEPTPKGKRAKRRAERMARAERMEGSGRARARETPPRAEPATPSERPVAERLRDVQADFDEIELRIRRMETHVTSGRYELHRELRRIGDPGPVAP